MFSTRFVPAVLVLLALAAVPTVIHSYMDSSVADGRTARAIPLRLAGQTGAAAPRRADWGDDRFRSTDWIDRRFVGPPEMKLVVARSFDPKRLYHHPELAVDYGQSYGTARTLRLSQRSDVPVHALRGRAKDSRRVALYTLHYDTQYVDDPISFQLRTSLRSLISRRLAMTLFFVAGDLPANDTVEGSSVSSLLLSAMDAFEKQRP